MMKISKLSLPVMVLIITTIFYCKQVIPNDPAKNAKLAGCWKGGMIEDNKIVKSYFQLRQISLRPDSSLALTAIFELSPRSRLWEYDTEIAFMNDTLSWLAHTGYLSGNFDTMFITKSWKGDVSQWMFFRDPGSDQMMQDLLSSKNTVYYYETPKITNDGWNTSQLTNEGIDEGKITNLIENIKDGEHKDIHSLLICRNGNLILEEYFAENGKLAGPNVNTILQKKTHHMASVTKGVISLLAGIAIDKGAIENVNTQVFSFFPEYAALNTGDKNRIELYHLLTMTAGLQWNQSPRIPMSDPRNDGGELNRTANTVQYVLAKPVVSEPGSKFVYSNGLTMLAGVIIEKTAGSLEEFAIENLFTPLGISDYQWTRYADGTIEADGGLAIRSRDLAKIGQLVLDNGKWNKKTLVSENWIPESIKRRYSLSPGRGYGYYWNEMLYEFNGKQNKAIFAPGDGGQFIAILPSLEMVIVITAGNYGINVTSASWDLIEEKILPAVTGIDFKE
ncbi:MAG: beta-lactamase family protein [Bacteroidales bacterium]|nr:beta-lactamase family protein [Bacteroidales bacterium]